MENKINISQQYDVAAKNTNAVIGCFDRHRAKKKRGDSSTVCCPEHATCRIWALVLENLLIKRMRVFVEIIGIARELEIMPYGNHLKAEKI